MTNINIQMIDKCPQCNEKIDILPEQEPVTDNISTMTSQITYATTFTGPSYPSTSEIYKCSNPKCWVTKIKENWE